MAVIEVERTGTVRGFRELLNRVLTQEQVKGLVILGCDANAFEPVSLDPILAQVPVPLFGGIFPEIIHSREKLTRGTIIIGLSTEPDVQVVPHLSDASVDYDAVIDEKFPDTDDGKTMFVLVDGLSRRISALIDSLFNIFGLEVNYIGGGAGSLSFEQKPCLFTNQGLVKDSALLAMMDMESGVGVSHGWQNIGGPFRVTEADRNVITSLDWQPAFQVYRRAVEQASTLQFTASNFFELAKCYPFGINRIDNERIVRDPIMVREDDALICVGEVPTESMVDILTGDVPSLVGAARRALTLAQDAYRGRMDRRLVFFIDCISRVLFLEEEFGQEIQAIYREGIPLVGALTLGEIANSGRDYLEFYNKTAVVGVMETL